MNRMPSNSIHLAELADAADLSHEKVALLGAVALTRAHICAGAIREVVIPLLSGSGRGFAMGMAGRMERRDVFTDGFLRELETFGRSLDAVIDRGTHICWQSDENHICGGYEEVVYEPGIGAIVACKAEIVMLRNTLLLALCSARALNSEMLLLSS